MILWRWWERGFSGGEIMETGNLNGGLSFGGNIVHEVSRGA